MQVVVAVVVAVIALLFAIGIAVGSQTGSMSSVTMSPPVLDPALEASLRTGAARSVSTGTITLTPGGGAVDGAVSAPAAFAAVEDVALHLPVGASQDVIFMEADSAAALSLVPVGVMTRNANPEGFHSEAEFEGPAYAVATPVTGVRPATGMAALLTAPGMPVMAPVQGAVADVAQYTSADGTTDWKVTVQPVGRPDLHVVIRRIEQPSVVTGQEITVGLTQLGTVRAGTVPVPDGNPLSMPAVLIHVRPATQGEVVDQPSS